MVEVVVVVEVEGARGVVEILEQVLEACSSHRGRGGVLSEALVMGVRAASLLHWQSPSVCVAVWPRTQVPPQGVAHRSR